MGYPIDRIYEEIVFLGYHLHWSYDDLMNMEHTERRRWVEEVSKLNKRINEEQKKET